MTREETIKRIKDWNLDDVKMEVLSVIIPEIKESEDEKIRKEITSFLKEGEPYYCPDTVKRQGWAAWLEKQGEQKPVWSEDDEERYISCLQRLGTGNLEQPETINTVWLKSLKERMKK